MSNSRWFAVVSLILGVVSCAAAIIVVPEVRCALGLETNPGRGCIAWRPFRSAVTSPYMPPGTVSNPARSVEASVRRIRVRFDQVERDQALGRLDSLRKEIQGLGGDSAYATVYFAGDEIPKIRARVFTGGVRTSYQAYYDGARLVFLYRTSSRLPATALSELEQQRFWIEDGHLVQWFDKPEHPVSSQLATYADAERSVSALGDVLLQGARAPGDVISF